MNNNEDIPPNTDQQQDDSIFEVKKLDVSIDQQDNLVKNFKNNKIFEDNLPEDEDVLRQLFFKQKSIREHDGDLKSLD